MSTPDVGWSWRAAVGDTRAEVEGLIAEAIAAYLDDPRPGGSVVSDVDHGERQGRPARSRPRRTTTTTALRCTRLRKREVRLP